MYFSGIFILQEHLVQGTSLNGCLLIYFLELDRQKLVYSTYVLAKALHEFGMDCTKFFVMSHILLNIFSHDENK